MSIEAIAPVAAAALRPIAPLGGSIAPAIGSASFADVLARGIATTEAKLSEADRLVTQFAIDDSIPLHRVTYALEEARISFELMLQVRNRLLEGAQQLLNLQL